MKTQWNLGKPFQCESCKAQLVIPRNFWIGLSAFVAFWVLKDRMQSTMETVLLIAALALTVLILSRIFLTPRSV